MALCRSLRIRSQFLFFFSLFVATRDNKAQQLTIKSFNVYILALNAPMQKNKKIKEIWVLTCARSGLPTLLDKLSFRDRVGGGEHVYVRLWSIPYPCFTTCIAVCLFTLPIPLST